MRSDPSAEDHIAIVRALFAAVEARGDVEAYEARFVGYVAAYDPDVVIREAESLPYGGAYRGAEGVVRHALAYAAAWEPVQAPADQALSPVFMATGDEVAVFWRQRGRRAGGPRFDMPVVSTYRLRNGRIVESRMFHFDAAAVADFLAGRPGAPVE